MAKSKEVKDIEVVQETVPNIEKEVAPDATPEGHTSRAFRS
jgi:hypothetical protein